MKEKYKVVILYTYYDNYINSIKAEEMKGNIEVVCVGCNSPKWNMLDGWPMMDTQSALSTQWDFLVYAGVKDAFLEVSEKLQKILTVTYDKILPVDIFGIPHFDFKGYVRLNERKISIISNHCWGGFTYHYLCMRFNSPFVNMFMGDEDYLKLLENFHYYISLEVEYVGEEYETNLKRKYPIGKLGDICLHFNHYISFEEVLQKWEERKKKMNMDNLFIHMSTESREYAERFDLLSYKNKIVFVPRSFGLESEINLEYFDDLGDGYDTKEVTLQLAKGNLRCYDVIKLLNGEKDFLNFL